MKKKIILLILIVALLALPLMACGGEKKAPTAKDIDLADYSMSLDSKQYGRETYTENTGYTAANKLNGIVMGTNGYGISILANTETQKYTLYDLASGQTLLNGQEFNNIVVDSATGCFKLINHDSVNNTSKWGVADWTGTKMLMEMTEIYTAFGVNIETLNDCYYENEITPSVIMRITYYLTADTLDYKYFRIIAEDMSSSPSIESVDENKLHFGSPSSVGSTVSALTRISIYPKGSIVKSVYGEMDAYSYSANLINSANFMKAAVTFYNGDTKKGTVNIKNGFVIGFIENYMYYAEVENLPYDAKSGYNVYEQTGSSFTSASKMNFTYYKYDIIKDKNKEINPGYVILPEGMEELYNYSDKKFDAASLQAVNLVDGVAVVNDSTDYKTYVVNSDLKVIADLSEKPFDFTSSITRLNDDRFMTKDNGTVYIIDKKLNEIASFSGNYTIYKSSQLIVYSDEDRYMAIDFNGNVVFEPKYSSLEFYGGVALTNVTNADSVSENYLVSKSNLSGSPANAVLGENETMIYANYGIIIKKNAENKITVYDYNGTQLLSVDKVASVQAAKITGGKLTLTATLTEGGAVSYLFS